MTIHPFPRKAAGDPHATSPSSPESSLIADGHFYLDLLRKFPLVRSTGDFGDDLFVEVLDGATPTLYPLASPRVHEAINVFADEISHGDPEAFVTAAAFHRIQDFFRAKAHRVAQHRPVFKRVGWLPEAGELWIDLGQPDGRCIRITAEDWSLATPPAPLFVRFTTQRPLAVPVPCSDAEGIAAFRRILPPGTTEVALKLLLGALIACRIPSGFTRSFSYPIIVITGDSGSGKSTLAKLILELTDHQLATTAAKPRSIDDLFVAAQTSHLLSYDNVDFIRGSLSDACCQLTTGSAHQKRALYTNSDLTILRAHAPILLNGINPDLPKQDFLDRTITIQLTRIEHFDADAVNEADADLPLVQGLLCNLLSRALANYDSVDLDDAPRLALVSKLATAAEPFSCPTPFVDLLRANQRDALTTARDNDPVVGAILDLLDHKATWTGTHKTLLAVLSANVDDAIKRTPEWPRTPHRLAGFIREHHQSLKVLGIEVTYGARQNTGRMVTLQRTMSPPAIDDCPF